MAKREFSNSSATKKGGKNFSNPRSGRRNSRNSKKRSYSKPKEVEINIDRNSINKADLQHSEENDVTWYTRVPGLMESACNYAYPLVLGHEINQELPFTYSYTPERNAIPGICTIYFIPSIGYSNSPTAPINTAARTQFTFQRYSNSRNAPYEAPDLMLMYLCADSAALYISMLKKIYGIIKNNPYQNAYYPLALCESMGVNYDSIIKNLTEFRTAINVMCYQFNRLALPADVYYFTRHQWLLSGLFTDSPTSMAQTYHFVPRGFYQWSEGENTGPNKAIMVSPWPGTTPAPTDNSGSAGASNFLTLEQLISFGQSLLDKLLSSQTVVENMGGDILKSYGAENLIFLPSIDENFTIVPGFSQEVLSEIENLDTANPPFSQMTVSQTTTIGSGYLISKPEIVTTISSNAITHAGAYRYMYQSGDKLINMHIEKPTPGDNMIATRFSLAMTSSYERTGSGSSLQGVVTTQLVGFGSEIVVAVHVSKLINALSTSSGLNYTNILRTRVQDYVHYPSISTNELFLALNGIGLIQQFDWHPRFSIALLGTDVPAIDEAGKMELVTIIGDTRDIDNYTTISNDKVSNAHGVALISLFDSPKAHQLVSQPYKR